MGSLYRLYFYFKKQIWKNKDSASVSAVSCNTVYFINEYRKSAYCMVDSGHSGIRFTYVADVIYFVKGTIRDFIYFASCAFLIAETVASIE